MICKKSIMIICDKKIPVNSINLMEKSIILTINGYISINGWKPLINGNRLSLSTDCYQLMEMEECYLTVIYLLTEPKFCYLTAIYLLTEPKLCYLTVIYLLPEPKFCYWQIIYLFLETEFCYRYPTLILSNRITRE